MLSLGCGALLGHLKESAGRVRIEVAWSGFSFDFDCSSIEAHFSGSLGVSGEGSDWACVSGHDSIVISALARLEGITRAFLGIGAGFESSLSGQDSVYAF